MILYPRFYWMYGVRRLTQVAQLPRHPLTLLELPKGAIYHYLPESSTDVGPGVDDFMYRNVTKFVMMQHVTDLTSLEGGPRRLPFLTQQAIQSYFMSHRRFKRIRDLKVIERDELTQICVNYALINRRYRYPKTMYAPWYRFINFQRTFWSNVNQIANESDRQHFIKVSIPTTLPTISELNKFSDQTSMQMLKVFHSDELKLLLEMWKWLGEERQSSVFNLIDTKNLDKVNLLFIDRHVWFVLNLGKLNSFRKATEAELELVNQSENPLTEDETKELVKGLLPNQIKKFFLRGLIEFNRNRFAEADTLPDQVQDAADEETTNPTQTPKVIDPTDPQAPVKHTNEGVSSTVPGVVTTVGDDTIIDLTVEPSPTTQTTQSQTSSLSGKTGDLIIDLTNANGELVGYDLNQIHHVESEIDEYLSILERTSQDLDASKDEVIVKPNPAKISVPEADPQDALMEVAEVYASVGAIRVADLARFERLSGSYKEIKLPNGQTIEEAMRIDPKDLKITNPPITPTKGILNQAMTGSTLDEFDSRYVSEVMDKDVLKSIMSLQKAGFAVTGLNREERTDITGQSVEYAIRITPIDGAPSTIRFTYPKPNEDGTFTVGGVKYYLAKQQGVHLPIKKTAPDEVALTSYYGKCFIRRPEVKVADYGNWLCNQIRLKSMTGETIRNAELSGDYKDSFKAPRLFSYLSKEIRSFEATIQGVAYAFNFSVQDHEAYFGKALVDKLETQGIRLCGKGPNSVVYVDANDDFYVYSGGKATRLGRIEDLLELNRQKAPVEYTEVGVMGKTIPVGFILGYETGLRALLEETQAKYRLVPVGERRQLEPNEYVIRFADVNLILDKNQVYQSLVFSGLTKYRNAISQYNFHEFNQKEVYLNVLEDSGLSTRIMTEIDLRYRMFIDSITHELLLEMGEPTTFGGLLRRATELLVDDYVPIVKDRVRGYERFSGIIYQELARAVRNHYNRYGRDRVPLDFDPYCVERAILTDTSKRQASDINPIEDLKQVESMTVTGTGGRTSRTMTKSTRAYQDQEQGLTAEATVDSSKVSVNTFTSANPKFNSLRGTYDEFVLGEDDPSRLVSTSMLVSPGADKDD